MPQSVHGHSYCSVQNFPLEVPTWGPFPGPKMPHSSTVSSNRCISYQQQSAISAWYHHENDYVHCDRDRDHDDDAHDRDYDHDHDLQVDVRHKHEHPAAALVTGKDRSDSPVKCRELDSVLKASADLSLSDTVTQHNDKQTLLYIIYPDSKSSVAGHFPIVKPT